MKVLIPYDGGDLSEQAAVMAIEGNTTVQDVPYSKLRERLLKDKQILEYSSATPEK